MAAAPPGPGSCWPPPRPEDLLTAQALVVLAQIHESLDRARVELEMAGQVEWVSDAADRFHAVLGCSRRDLDRSAVTLHEARPVILRHTRTADAYRTATHTEAERPLPDPWQRGPLPSPEARP